MSTPFKLSDGGRSQSKRPRQKNDCVVRAIALAFERPYDEVYALLAAEGRACGRATSHLITNSWLSERAKYRSFPAEKGQPRMNLARFAEEHPRGRFVAKMAGHVVAVIDGVVFDTIMPRMTACVYCAWTIDVDLAASSWDDLVEKSLRNHLHNMRR